MALVRLLQIDGRTPTIALILLRDDCDLATVDADDVIAAAEQLIGGTQP